MSRDWPRWFATATSFGVGGHHFARLPIALLRAIAGSGVKDLRYVCWAGGLPLELLLEADAVAEIDICFSSLDIFGLPPRFRAAAETNAVPVRDWTALAMIQALRAAQQNLPSMPFQLPRGSDMLARMPGANAGPIRLPATEIGIHSRLAARYVRRPRPARRRKRQCRRSSGRARWTSPWPARRGRCWSRSRRSSRSARCGNDGRQSILTRNQVSAIALAPGGAYPASCLPFYVTDYQALSEAFASQGHASGGQSAPAIRRRSRESCCEKLRKSALKRSSPCPRSCAARQNASVDEIIAARIAAELGNDSFASAGAVSPLANVAYRLAKATHAPDMIIATMSCGHLDIAPSPMILSLIESLDCETAVAHAGGDDTYSTYYQAGAVTHEIVGAAQVDRRGRVNTIALRKRDGGIIRLPGQGGMADVANMHRDYLLYVPRHSVQSLVEEVEIASSARGLLTPAEREPHGYRTGKALVFTDLCVFQLDPIDPANWRSSKPCLASRASRSGMPPALR